MKELVRMMMIDSINFSSVSSRWRHFRAKSLLLTPDTAPPWEQPCPAAWGRSWNTAWSPQGGSLGSDHPWEHAGGAACLPVADPSRTLSEDPAQLHGA